MGGGPFCGETFTPFDTGCHLIPQVLFDTDPGVDDALALLWLASLHHQHRCRLVAVTTVEGNVDSRQTFANANRLLNAVRLQDVPLGAGRYYRGGRDPATHIHGHDGLGGLSESLVSSKLHYDEAPDSQSLILETLARPGHEVSLCAVGPLSNLAQAQTRRPEILSLAREVIVMGGAIREGNTAQFAEFNMHYDPVAANRVLKTCPGVVVIPLNVTRQLLFTPEYINWVTEGLQGNLPRLVAQLTEFMNLNAEQRGSKGFFVHDAATVAYLISPELFAFEHCRLTVDTSGRESDGETIKSLDEDETEPNAWVATSVRVDKVLEQMCQDLRYLLDQSINGGFE